LINALLVFCRHKKYFCNAARSSPIEKKEKEKKEIIFLRIPKSLHDNLERICDLTGYKKNMFCLQAILEAAKDKLKQIERES
jgi:uncharacterized protein (DUF1778 family)